MFESLKFDNKTIIARLKNFNKFAENKNLKTQKQTMKKLILIAAVVSTTIIASCDGEKKKVLAPTIDSMTVKPKAGTIDSMTVTKTTSGTIDSMTVKPK